jgi:hypothetical protein
MPKESNKTRKREIKKCFAEKNQEKRYLEKTYQANPHGQSSRGEISRKNESIQGSKQEPEGNNLGSTNRSMVVRLMVAPRGPKP